MACSKGKIHCWDAKVAVSACDFFGGAVALQRRIKTLALKSEFEGDKSIVE
jgi:hypothetical protein